MTETSSKLIIALAIFSISFLSASAPLKVINVNDHIFSCGNLMASGVLLSGGLVHQLPDSIGNLDKIDVDFPLATFLAGLTFCFFLIMEEYLHNHLEHNPFEERPVHATENNEPTFEYPIPYDSVHGDDYLDEKGKQIEREIKQLESIMKKMKKQSNANDDNETKDDPNDQNCRYQRSSITFISPLPRTGQSSDHHEPTETSSFLPRIHSGHGILSIRKSVRPSVFNTWRKASFDTKHPIHHHDDHLAEHMHGSFLASIILLFALSIHSIFEGLAIGISSDLSGVMSTAAAVLAHKAFAGYALGSSMIASQMNDSHFFVLVFIFSFCSMMGIILGMLCEQLTSAGNVHTVTGIIQAMVAGTFLYVSIVEIGMKEFMMHRDSENPKNNGLSSQAWDTWKLAAFLFGYLCMSSLAIWV